MIKWHVLAKLFFFLASNRWKDMRMTGFTGMRLARSRDDMESLRYVLLFLLRGRLPWQGLKANSEEEKDRMVLELKQSA